jgi:hypothetical protein
VPATTDSSIRLDSTGKTLLVETQESAAVLSDLLLSELMASSKLLSEVLPLITPTRRFRDLNLSRLMLLSCLLDAESLLALLLLNFSVLPPLRTQSLSDGLETRSLAATLSRKDSMVSNRGLNSTETLATSRATSGRETPLETRTTSYPTFTS